MVLEWLYRHCDIIDITKVLSYGKYVSHNVGIDF